MPRTPGRGRGQRSWKIIDIRSPRSRRRSSAASDAGPARRTRPGPVTRAGRRSRPMTAMRQRRLAAARLAHDAQDLARGDAQRDVGHRRDDRVLAEPDRPRTSGRGTRGSLAHSARSSGHAPRIEPAAQPVAHEVNASTVMAMAMPGKTSTQGACVQHVAAVGQHQPSDGVGGWAPSPRNESAASIWMAKPHEHACPASAPGPWSSAGRGGT